MDWTTVSTSLVSAIIGVIVTAMALKLKNKLSNINDITEIKLIVKQHNSLLLALAKAMFASSKEDKDAARQALLEAYSKLGGE